MKPSYSVFKVTLLTAMISMFTTELVTAQNWYNVDWQYRRAVTIPNSGATLTDYQVKIDLISPDFNFSNTNADGSDIRLSESDGITLIPFWIEEWIDGTQATIWVKIPGIPMGGTSVYLYYGNPAVTGVSNGDNTFEFFDDFESAITTEPGYYAFGPASTIMVEDQTWETSAPHNLSVVEAPAGAAYNYYGYYGLQGCGGIGMGGSDDLLNWTKFPESSASPPINPLFAGGGERWASVFLDGSTYYMVHTMNYCGTSYVVYRQSTDGLNWTAATQIVPAVSGNRNQNPCLFHDPNDNQYYMYWFRNVGTRKIMVRTASTVAGLISAPDIELLSSAATLAAPNMLYYDGTYFLSTEIFEGVWKVRIYSGTSPLGPFSILPGNPVLDDGCACLFQTFFSNMIYEYYCKETSGTWTLDMRVVDPSTGRIMYEQGEIDPTKWTPESGGTWSATSDTQQNGTEGIVAEGSTSAKSLLKSSFSGSDYILEGYGRQIADRVWGFGFRTTNAQNTYVLNIYEDLDATNNLYLYKFSSGGNATVWNTGLGIIDHNIWYKLTVKAYGSNFDIYVDDVLKTTTPAFDNSWPSGSIALYGESGTIAQFNDIRVRKYAASEPVTSVGEEQINCPAAPVAIASLQPTCSEPTGTITVTSSLPGLHFSIDGLDYTNTTGIFTLVQPDDYYVTAMNEDGCISTPSSIVTINEPECATVNGTFKYYNSAFTLLENVTIKLQQGGVDKYTTTPSTSTGNYSFTYVYPGTYDVMVTTDNPVGSINATDAAQVNYWGTGLWEIEKVRFYAGDAVLNNLVDANDASKILSYFVTAGASSISPTWKFWLAGETISANPGPPPSGLQLPSVTYAAGLITQDIYGMCTGDFNQSFIPGSSKSASETLILKHGKTIYAETGDELELPIYAGMDMDVGAVSLILNFPSDKMEISDVFLTSDPSSPILYNISGDELRIGWNSLIPGYLNKGESLITLKIKVIDESGAEGISMALVADPLNELADSDFFVINDAVLVIDVIHTSALGVIEYNLADNLELANHPNPFKGTTIFEYSLPVDGEVILEIYDLVGNIIKVAVDETQTAGDYTLKLDATTLQPGVYMATLRLSNEDSTLIRAIKIISR